MKKEYAAPKAERMEFNYSETVTASNGNSWQKYIDKTSGTCQDTPTDEWWVGMVAGGAGCTKL